MTNLINFFKPAAEPNGAAQYEQALRLIRTGENTKSFASFDNGMKLLKEIALEAEDPKSEAALKAIKDILNSYALRYCDDLTSKNLRSLNSPFISERQFNQGRDDKRAVKAPILRPS